MSDDPSERRHILVGTAGHIDHGKTRLVTRLTGIDTDRLPEEKSRGISIDLGFAHWDQGNFRFGVVDVPGHERFVKNMVAGAAGVNIALLVVAADDGVMPQTREHLDIMDLLGISRGLAVINKTDLVESDLVELVREEIAEVTADTFLAGSPVVAVSSETGEGVEELRAEILKLAKSQERAELQSVFRLPIDRAISLPGHGTIVTGSSLCGRIAAGDVLELLPEGREVRVRSIENHGDLVAGSGPRARTAINLAGVKRDEVERGMELATPGVFRPSRRLLVELRALPSSPIELKDRQEFQLHLATNEVTARLALKGRTLIPGEAAYAELRTKSTVVAAHGQRFILRRLSPAVTIAGGIVLDPAIPVQMRIREMATYGDAMKAANPAERISYLLKQPDADGDSVAFRAGVAPGEFKQVQGDLLASGELLELPSRARSITIHRERLEVLATAVMRTIRATLEIHQPRRLLPRPLLLTAAAGIADSAVLEAVFSRLIETNQLAVRGDLLGPADMQVKLSKRQRKLSEDCLQRIRDAGLAVPTVKELAAESGATPNEVADVLRLAADEEQVTRISDQLFLDPKAVKKAQEDCVACITADGPATVSELREAWGVTRKHAVPLAEFFDSQHVTERDGDRRKLGRNTTRS